MTVAVAAYGASAATTSTARAETGASPATVRAELPRPAAQDVAAGAARMIVRVDNGRGPVIRIARQTPWSRSDHGLPSSTRAQAMKRPIADEFRMGPDSKAMVAIVVPQLVAVHRVRRVDPAEERLRGTGTGPPCGCSSSRPATCSTTRTTPTCWSPSPARTGLDGSPECSGRQTAAVPAGVPSDFRLTRQRGLG